jgi:hypothetical protein
VSEGTQQPVSTSRIIAYTFGGHTSRGDDDLFDNGRLALALRAAADWVDSAPKNTYIERVFVDTADEFGTWWVTVYVQGVAE